MKRKVILALDLGTTTGWALRGHNGAISHGSVNLKPDRFQGGGMRFLLFTDWLNQMKSLCGRIDALYYEEVRRHMGVDAAHIYGGFQGHLSAWCEEHQIPYQGVPVGTIKKHVSGKGNASKHAVITAVKQRGFNAGDDNEADALAILFYKIDKENR